MRVHLSRLACNLGFVNQEALGNSRGWVSGTLSLFGLSTGALLMLVKNGIVHSVDWQRAGDRDGEFSLRKAWHRYDTLDVRSIFNSLSLACPALVPPFFTRFFIFPASCRLSATIGALVALMAPVDVYHRLRNMYLGVKGQ